MALGVLFLITLSSSLCFGDILSTSKCKLELNVMDTVPLLAQSGQTQLIYPKVGEDHLDFASGQKFDILCPGKKVNVGSTSYDDIASATCVSGTTLRVSGTTASWNRVSCSGASTKSARWTGEKCGNNGKEVEIGFFVKDSFIRSILVCFDDTTQEALHSHTLIPASVNRGPSNVPRPSWVQGGGFYKIPSINRLYTQATQRTTLNALLGLPASSTKYVQKNNRFLAKGHLTAMRDGFYPSQQELTFFLINAAPQWQTLNDGNWKVVESDVRDFAESRRADLLVWTGVYGIATLPHETTGEATKLFLYDKNGLQALPVPEIFWKVVYEPNSQNGIAILAINNPYSDSYTPICEDVSDNINWINWKKDDQQRGFGYVCTVDSFRRVVKHLPTFDVHDILT